MDNVIISQLTERGVILDGEIVVWNGAKCAMTEHACLFRQPWSDMPTIACSFCG